MHKYAVGAEVHDSPGIYEDKSARGLYRVVWLLPEEGNMPQYRIKATVGGQERVAREEQLSPL